MIFNYLELSFLILAFCARATEKFNLVDQPLLKYDESVGAQPKEIMELEPKGIIIEMSFMNQVAQPKEKIIGKRKRRDKWNKKHPRNIVDMVVTYLKWSDLCNVLNARMWKWALNDNGRYAIVIDQKKRENQINVSDVKKRQKMIALAYFFMIPPVMYLLVRSFSLTNDLGGLNVYFLSLMDKSPINKDPSFIWVELLKSTKNMMFNTGYTVASYAWGLSMYYLWRTIKSVLKFFNDFRKVICKNSSMMRKITNRDYMQNAKNRILHQSNVHSVVAAVLCFAAGFKKIHNDSIGFIFDFLVFSTILFWLQFLKYVVVKKF